jgi:Tol biopolymer transport system component
MTDSRQTPSTPPEHASGDRLDSWKEIAAYMRRDAKTVQRWEKREGMPVHRHLHDKAGSVYAFRTELDAWAAQRRVSERAPLQRPGRLLTFTAVGAVAALALAALITRPSPDHPNPLAGARFEQVTDFSGIEQAAAISRDGRFVAFLSDRDGPVDVWLTQVGSGEFHNLTHGTARELVNPSVRTLGFSPDGTAVTFWARRLDVNQRAEINLWAVPVLGGSPRLFLEGAAEYAWSSDASQLVYHTPGPGDPTFVRRPSHASSANQIFAAPEGLHAHFPLWSPDGGYIYLVQGSVPDRMDIWRVEPTGAAAEQITHHAAAVSHPVFLDAHTLAYLSTDSDGLGPWIYTFDLERRVSRRAVFGIDKYSSLAVSGDGRRLVATEASPKTTLWRVPIGSEVATPVDARPIPLTTGNGSSPRLGAGFLMYVSSKGAGDGIWKLEGERTTEIWNSPDMRVIGGPAIARDGARLAFSARRADGLTSLLVINSDGTDSRIVATSLELRGAPAWTPDGTGLTVGALVDSVPFLFTVPVDGRPPLRVVHEHSMDPAWSPDGRGMVFTGADVGTTFPVKAIAADGTPHRIPQLTLTRGSRHVAFLPDARSLVVMRGETRRKNLWAIDLETGAERQLTNFGPEFQIQDFDVAPDGRDIVIVRVEEQADIVLLEVPR